MSDNQIAEDQTSISDHANLACQEPVLQHQPFQQNGTWSFTTNLASPEETNDAYGVLASSTVSDVEVPDVETTVSHGSSKGADGTVAAKLISIDELAGWLNSNKDWRHQSTVVVLLPQGRTKADTTNHLNTEAELAQSVYAPQAHPPTLLLGSVDETVDALKALRLQQAEDIPVCTIHAPVNVQRFMNETINIVEIVQKLHNKSLAICDQLAHRVEGQLAMIEDLALENDKTVAHVDKTGFQLAKQLSKGLEENKNEFLSASRRAPVTASVSFSDAEVSLRKRLDELEQVFEARLDSVVDSMKSRSRDLDAIRSEFAQRVDAFEKKGADQARKYSMEIKSISDLKMKLDEVTARRTQQPPVAASGRAQPAVSAVKRKLQAGEPLGTAKRARADNTLVQPSFKSSAEALRWRKTQQALRDSSPFVSKH